MRRFVRLALFPIALFTLGACGTSPAPADARADGATETGADTGPVDDVTSTDADASNPVDASADGDFSDAIDTTSPDDVPSVDGSDASTDASAGATLFGQVRRSAVNSNGADGVGDLYIAVFTDNPITAGASAMRVGEQVIRGVDLSTTTARVDYRITGIPPRAQPYYVSAVLDDNNNITPTAARPDRGDSLNGVSPPMVTLTTATEQMYEIDLSFVLPFDT